MSRSGMTSYCSLFALLVAACGADSGSAPSTKGNPPSASKPVQESATGKAYDALTAGEQEKVTQVIADVDDAVTKDPSDGRSTFYSAIMRFWQLGEEIDLPANAVDELTEAQTMIDRFRSAQAMLPNDDRAPAFGGLAKVIIANIVGDTKMHAEGISDIEKGIQIFPSYSHFLRALASVESPADSDDFRAVLPEMQAVVDACGIGAGGQMKYLAGPLPSALRPCNDDGIVPHVWEGFFLNYGDMLLKAGKGGGAARAIYENAKLAPRFDKWPFASALQDRIDHADERAALYADGDASNDPKLWVQDGHICTGCHQDSR